MSGFFDGVWNSIRIETAFRCWSRLATLSVERGDWSSLSLGWLWLHEGELFVSLWAFPFGGWRVGGVVFDMQFLWWWIKAIYFGLEHTVRGFPKLIDSSLDARNWVRVPLPRGSELVRILLDGNLHFSSNSVPSWLIKSKLTFHFASLASSKFSLNDNIAIAHFHACHLISSAPSDSENALNRLTALRTSGFRFTSHLIVAKWVVEEPLSPGFVISS